MYALDQDLDSSMETKWWHSPVWGLIRDYSLQKDEFYDGIVGTVIFNSNLHTLNIIDNTEKYI